MHDFIHVHYFISRMDCLLNRLLHCRCECFQKILEPTNSAVIFKYDDGKIVNLTKCNSPHIFRSGLLLLTSFEMINLLNSKFIILGTVITGVIMILLLFFCATYTYVKQNYKIDFIIQVKNAIFFLF